MIYAKKIGSHVNDFLFGIVGNETKVQKYSKIALGLGVAGLAAISWKVTVTAGVLYSAYKGAELAWGRFFQRKEVRREAGSHINAALVMEDPLAAPIQGGQDAHGDQEEHDREEVIPQIHLESVEDQRNRMIADLRVKRREMMAHPRARDPKKIGLVFDAIIYHSKVYQKGANANWLGEKIAKYGKMSSSKLQCMIVCRKAKWKLKKMFHELCSCVNRGTHDSSTGER